MDNESQKHLKKSQIFWVKLSVALLGLTLILIIKNGFQHINNSEALTSAKGQTWTADFKKSFRAECEENATNDLLDEFELEFESLLAGQAKVIEVYAGTYCNCMSDKVESAHVITVDLNNYRKVASNEAQIVADIQKYMESDEGMQATEECILASENALN